MISNHELLIIAKKKLRYANIDSYSLDAELLLSKALNTSREDLLLLLRRSPSNAQLRLFIELVKHRLTGIPIAYILQQREFWGINFYVNENTLIPRPETELLIELATKYFDLYSNNISDEATLLDMGTGSGCILLSLLTNIPKITKGIGIDISYDAIKVAKHNAIKLNLNQHCYFVISDWFSALKPENQFELILSNPPYISHSEWRTLDKGVHYEPKIALTDHYDGLAHYRTIISQLNSFLNNNGIAIMEFGYNQAHEVREIVEENHLSVIEIAKDLAGIERAIVIMRNTI